MHRLEIKHLPLGVVVHLDVGVDQLSCDLLQSFLLPSVIGVVENESVSVVVKVVCQVAILVVAEELAEHLVIAVAGMFVLHHVGKGKAL